VDAESLSFVGRAASEGSVESDSIVPFSHMVYFSFVTMSTLGYGDVLPKTPLAQTLAWMQSVLGQFYLAVLVAWLVSALPRGPSPAAGVLNERDKENNQ
jgi:hypothetical protein